MRRRIRLTGRRQLSRSSVELKIAEVPGKRLLTLGIAEKRSFQGFPADARVSVKLFENKLVEIADFGPLGSLNPVVEIKNKAFVAPSHHCTKAVLKQAFRWHGTESRGR
jgi:hypothetical protein